MIPRKSNDLLKSKFRCGRCSLCGKSGCRLEAHHIRYSPEVTIDLCHDCHFRVHYHPQRLSESELYKLLCRTHKPETMAKYQGHLKDLLNLSHTLTHSLSEKPERSMAASVAPSRSEFLDTQHALDVMKKRSEKEQREQGSR